VRSPIRAPLTTAVVALAIGSMALGACQPSPPAISDPKQILVQSLQAFQKAKTVHLAATLDGALPVNTSGSTTPITIDGTTADADVDVAGNRLHATFKIPALFGLAGDVIEAGGASYLKTTFTGPKYIAGPGGLPGGGGLASPVGSSASADQVASLRAFLDESGVTVQKNTDAQCGSRTCYQVTVTVPAGAAGSSSAEPAGSLLPGLPSLPIDLSNASLTVVVTVEKDTLRPVTVSATAALGAEQTLRATLTISNWDTAVAIEAPPADQVGQGTGGLQFPFPVPSLPFFPIPSSVPLPTM